VSDVGIIETSRLRLVLLSPAALELLRDGDLAGASTVQGCAFTDEFLATVNEAFVTNHLETSRRNRANPGWTVRAIVRRDDGRVLGHCGFHGTPQDVGRAEIGYTVFAPFRGCGYATESAQGLVRWARAQGTPVVFAAVAPHNEASLGVVRRLGFRQTGVHDDDVDGEELVFALDL
jgi:RimJ/RimL family protein N-acetyltransferase